jgi:hypothetical protein
MTSDWFHHQTNLPPLDCDCCAGTETHTPGSVANFPGQDALAYRVGTYSDFLATMKSHLTSLAFPADGDNPLKPFTTRRQDDPAIALLDAWAVAADVLTFYQERIANEGYLPTAREERSIRELAALVGYQPRPGVAANVPLAFTLEAGARTMIKRGQSAKSIPDPGQTAQTFETAEDLEARGEWSALKPLLSRVQTFANAGPGRDLADRTLFLKGLTTNLKGNDPLVLLFDDRTNEVWRVKEVTPDPSAGTTALKIELWTPLAGTAVGTTRKKVLEALDTYRSQPDLTFTRNPNLARRLERLLQPFRSIANNEPGATISPPLLLDNVHRLQDFQQKLIGERECPPLDALVVSLDESVRLSDDLITDFARALKTYDDFGPPVPYDDFRPPADQRGGAVKGPRGGAVRGGAAPAAHADQGGNTAERLAVPYYLFLADKADRATQDALDAFATKREEAIGTLRDVQRTAFLSRFGPLAERVAGVATALSNLDAQSAPAAVRDAVKGLLQKAPLFTRTEDLLAHLRDDLARDPATDSIVLGVHIRPVLTELFRGFLPRKQGAVSALHSTLQDAVNEGIGQVSDGQKPDRLTKLLGRTDIEDGTKVVKRVRDAFDKLLTKPLANYKKWIPQLSDTEKARLFQAIKEPAVKGDFGVDIQDQFQVAQAEGGIDNTFFEQFLGDALRALNAVAWRRVLRGEAVFFEGGGFPRIKPWFDDLVAELEQFLGLLPRAVDARKVAGVVAAQAALTRLLGAGVLGAVRMIAPPQGPIVPPAPAGQTPSRPLAEVIELFQTTREDPLGALFKVLLTRPPRQPPRVSPPLTTLFGVLDPQQGPGPDSSGQADAAAQVFQALNPALQGKLYPALGKADIGRNELLPRVEAPRAAAAPFGSVAPLRTISLGADPKHQAPITTTREWPLANTLFSIRAVNVGSAPISPEVSVGPPEAVVTKTIPPKGEAVFPDGITVRCDSKGAPAFTVEFTGRGAKRTFSVEPTNPPGTDGVLTFSIDGFTTPWKRPDAKDADTGYGVNLELRDGRVTLSRPRAGADVLVISGEIELPLLPNERRVLTLDAVYDKITPGSHIVIQRAEGPPGTAQPNVYRVDGVEAVAVTGYGLSAKVTRLLLDGEWLDANDTSLAAIRGTSVLIQGEPLELAEEPYDADVFGDRIYLDGVYDGLVAGRELIVEGERTDLPGTRGVTAAEAVVVATSEQSLDASGDTAKGGPALPVRPGPGERALDAGGKAHGEGGPPRTSARRHTNLRLTRKLSFSYKRDTVTIYGNVVKATHGETWREVLGNGDSSVPRQHFVLRQGLLTYLPAPTPSGAADTLEVRVNDVLWHEARRLSELGPLDQGYLVFTDEQGVATVQFGDGRQGARPPTGTANIRAVYRTGIGKAGNVKTRQISQLGDRPAGVKDVINPLPAAGGADRETPDQARRNTPVGLVALERLVSVSDYEDFARSFAGIAKAKAARLPGAGSFRVHVTVAGLGDIPLEDGDLLTNLEKALRLYGDPTLPVVLETRRLRLIVMEAFIRIAPDYLWEKVEQAVRDRLLELLGFERRELAQDVFASPVLAAIQEVKGVRSARFTALGLIPERDDNDNPFTPNMITQEVAKIKNTKPPDCLSVYPACWSNTKQTFVAAEIAYLSSQIPATLVLLPEDTP